MKKILTFLLAFSFGNFLLAEGSVSVSGPITVEVGVPYNYTLQFTPVYPTDSNGETADQYIITNWTVTTGTSGAGGSPSGYINTPSNPGGYYSDSTYNSTNPKTVPIQWGSGGTLNYDTVTVRVSGIYRKSSTGANIGYFNVIEGTLYISTIQRLNAPNISIASSVPDCDQTNITATIANFTNAQQYLWTASGGATIVSSAGSSAVVKPSVSGSFGVSCQVNRLANPAYTKTGSKTVARNTYTSSAYISGNPKICTTNTFSITGLAAGETVAWALSNSVAASLGSTTGNSTTVTKTGGGAVTLSATILNSCGTQSVIKYLALFAGPPQSYQLVRASNETCDKIKYHYVPFEIPNYNPLVTYTFNIAPIPGVTVTVSTATYNGVVQHVMRFPKTYVGPVDFTVTSSTPCGSLSSYNEADINSCANLGLRIANTIEGRRYETFPNPAKNFIIVAVMGDEVAKTTINDTAELFDMMGLKQASISLSGQETTVDTASLHKGIYILKIRSAGKVETHRIVIE